MMIRNGAVVAIYKSHLQSEAAIGKCNNICNKNESKEQHYENDPLAPAFGSDELVFGISISLRASDMDDRIESSAAKSYVFKTLLKNDSIKTESKNGVVTLTGTVANANDGSMARTRWKICRESRAWTINWSWPAINRRNIPTPGSA